MYFAVTNPNYQPVLGSETITINPRTIRLTTASESRDYDGTALTNPNWSYDTDNEGFVTGQGFATATANGTITNFGTTPNGFTYTLTGATSVDNYTIDATPGTLEITKADTLSVDAVDYVEKYDGHAHGVTADANVDSGTVIYYRGSYSANPEDYTLTASPTATHVGESRTVYFVALNNNYEPAFGDALITITPRSVILTGASETREYNGTALTNAAVIPTGDGFLTGEGYVDEPVATGTVTNAGQANNPVLTGELNTSTQAADYAVTKLPGTLRVTAKELTVQADEQQIAYPAAKPAVSALTHTYVSGVVGSETPAYGGTLGYSAALPAGTLTPDTYEDAIVGGTLALANNGTFLAINYTLTVLPGDLKVVNGAFTVDLTGGSWTYDGTPYGPGLTGTTTGDRIEYFIPDGHGGWTSTGTTPPTVTNVADGPLTVKVVVTRAGYEPAQDTAILTILPAETGADSDGYTGTYDGHAYGITVEPDVNGSTVRYSLTGGTNPATYLLTESPTATDVTPGTTVYFAVTNPNYQPVLGSETITINPRTIRLTTASESRDYDGTALTNPNWSYDTDNEGFVTGQGFATATANGTITNFGTTPNGFTYTLTGATSVDNYTIDATPGTLEITKADTLSVDAVDYVEKYDGHAHGVTADANVDSGTDDLLPHAATARTPRTTR